MRTKIIVTLFLLSTTHLIACGSDDDIEFNDDEFEEDEGDDNLRGLTWTTQNGLTNISLNALSWGNTWFQKLSGKSYTICISPSIGTPNLYGDYDGAFAGVPNVNNAGFAQYWSQNAGLTSDCIWFNSAQTGPYYLGVYGNSAPTFKLWRVDSPIASVPTGFSSTLAWPLPNSCQNLVNHYSGFNSPWGNDEDINRPFFPNNQDKIHSGVDIACVPNTDVKSACDGTVVRRGNLLAQWGQFLVVQCDPKQGTNLTIYYDHINYTAALNAKVTRGTKLGTVFNMDVAGEGDHLHLAICVGTDQQCIAAKDPISGNLPKESFPGMMINPWKVTNGGLYQ
jgi:hypothetical protein